SCLYCSFFSLFIFFFYSSPPHLDLYSFPTRRSSDLAIIFIMQFDAEQLWKVAPIAYGLGITLLVLVLIFYSRAYALKTGAKSWLAFGPLTFQPSEVMKPAYILMLGRVVAQHNAEFYEHTIKTDWNLIGKLALWTLPVAVLLKLQNDFGTMLVFFAILSGVILVSGVSW